MVTVVLIGGFALIALGVLVRIGLLRAPFAVYDVGTMPTHVRNGPLALVPTGLSLLFSGLTIEFGQRGYAVWTTVTFGATVGCLVLTLRCLYRPPEWAKPAWLGAYEREVAPAGEAEQSAPEVPAVLYVALWAGWAVTLALVFFLDLPRSLLAGLGLSVGLLLAFRPRRGASTTARTKLMKAILGERVPDDG